MGIIYALLAGLFLTLTNLTTRKGIDVGGNAKGYFVFQMATSFLFALILGPVRSGSLEISLPAALLGMGAGALLSIMLFALGKAVEKGPPAFTFAILNSATVIPGLLMALVFGASLGYIYNGWHLAGSAFVLYGLFLGTRGCQGLKEMRSWLVFASVMFVFHVLLLALFQWRGMQINLGSVLHSEWFTPFMFATSGLVQLGIYLRARPSKPALGEIAYGAAGGLSNLLCTLFLLQATIAASPVENAVIFPIYSVMAIVFTNLWGQRLYGEVVNWRACQLSLFGLIVGTVDWTAIAAAIGF